MSVPCVTSVVVRARVVQTVVQTYNLRGLSRRDFEILDHVTETTQVPNDEFALG